MCNTRKKVTAKLRPMTCSSIPAAAPSEAPLAMGRRETSAVGRTVTFLTQLKHSKDTHSKDTQRIVSNFSLQQFASGLKISM
uniref:Uncharacterized protein n=1 Tax=Pristionchus pacificus TaxID=54126 RepID=A0A2A6CEY2_PRIPA|eukprot:PDM76764.1 hypothetical protein PRIPAC_42159 [Pristionchus pacificus]